MFFASDPISILTVIGINCNRSLYVQQYDLLCSISVEECLFSPPDDSTEAGSLRKMAGDPGVEDPLKPDTLEEIKQESTGTETIRPSSPVTGNE